MTTNAAPAFVRRAYLAIVCLLVGTVVWGFWRGYWAPLLTGGVEHFWFVHLHAAVFLGWMLLLLVQSILATRAAVRAHRALGAAGMGYGTVVLCVGTWVSIAAPAARVLPGGSLDYALVWLAPWLLGMATDVAIDRRVHPTLLWGGVPFAAMFFRVPLDAAMPGAHAVGHVLLAPFL